MFDLLMASTFGDNENEFSTSEQTWYWTQQKPSSARMQIEYLKNYGNQEIKYIVKCLQILLDELILDTYLNWIVLNEVTLLRGTIAFFKTSSKKFWK